MALTRSAAFAQRLEPLGPPDSRVRVDAALRGGGPDRAPEPYEIWAWVAAGSPAVFATVGVSDHAAPGEPSFELVWRLRTELDPDSSRAVQAFLASLAAYPFRRGRPFEPHDVVPAKVPLFPSCAGAWLTDGLSLDGVPRPGRSFFHGGVVHVLDVTPITDAERQLRLADGNDALAEVVGALDWIAPR